MIDQLPAIQLLLTLLAAPICSMLRSGSRSWLLATIVSWASVACACALLYQVWGGKSISYEMGGWPPPWGIEVVIDELTAIVLLLVTLFGALVMTALRESLTTIMRPLMYSYFWKSLHSQPTH